VTSLYKRATPSQAYILRVVEGAIKNATDAHPDLIVSAKYRRSIAKRAAGTLSAQWADVLAAKPSESGGVTDTIAPRKQSPHLARAAGRGGLQLDAVLPVGSGGAA
jgi:hypothetical protein